MINDKNGALLTSKDKIRNRWKEYIEDLYDKENRPEMEELYLENHETIDPETEGPELLDSEISEAIKCLKRGKAEGGDGIQGEFLGTWVKKLPNS